MRFTMESRGKAFEITCDDSVFVMAVGKVKNQPPDLTAGEFNRGE